MWITALYHTEMIEELATLRAVMSSAAELALGCLPNETFRVEVVGELVAKFWRLEDQRSWLERPSVRICDLVVGPPSNQARLADRLDEATEQLGRSWLLGGRRTLSWRPCGLRLRGSGTWC
jgi:hypothetical protein